MREGIFDFDQGRPGRSPGVQTLRDVLGKGSHAAVAAHRDLQGARP